MRGKDAPRKWHTTALVLDLAAREPKWQEFKQPFKRRALAAAPQGGKLYVVGGLGMEKSTSEVNVYDPKAGKWTTAPDLPGASKHGFSPAACEAGGRLYVSTSDGQLHRLRADGKGWEPAGKTGKRLVHRLVPGEKGQAASDRRRHGGDRGDDAEGIGDALPDQASTSQTAMSPLPPAAAVMPSGAKAMASTGPIFQR